MQKYIMQKYIISQSTATFLYFEAYYLIIFHRKGVLVFSGRTRYIRLPTTWFPT